MLEFKIKKNEWQREHRKRPDAKRKRSEYGKKYNERPDVIKRIKKQSQDPDFIKRKKEYMKKYKKTYVRSSELREKNNRKERERRKNPKVKKLIKEKSIEYRNRPEIKERYKHKRNSPEVKRLKKEYYKIWLNKPEVQERLIKYRKDYYQTNKERIKQYPKSVPDKVKIWNRNHFNKRKQLGTTFLFENPFPKEIEIDFHHFNRLLMIPMPRITHRYINGHHRDITSHLNHNKKWIEKLYNLDVDSLIRGELGDTRLFKDTKNSIGEDMGVAGEARKNMDYQRPPIHGERS